MITEEEKYKAETLKVVGIAMLTPIGGLFLTPLVLLKQFGPISFAIYAIVSFLSTIIGVMILGEGRRILRIGEKKIWDLRKY